MTTEKTPTFDHEDSNKTGAWETFEKHVTATMEEFCLKKQAMVKTIEGCSHFPELQGQTALWAFVSHKKQVLLSSYPITLDGTERWHTETNMQRNLYWAAVQQKLYSILDNNFGEYEKGIFEKFNPSLNINASDMAALGEAVAEKSVIPEDEGGDHLVQDARWPYGTYAFLTIKEIYKGQKSVHVFTLMSEYELLRKKIKSMEFSEWTKQVKSKKHELDKAKAGQDPEYLDCMGLLLDMSAHTAWKEWAQTDATKSDTTIGYYTVDQLFHRAMQINDMRKAGRQQVKLAEAQAAEAMLDAGAHIGGGRREEAKHKLECTKCKKTFYSIYKNHKFCD